MHTWAMLLTVVVALFLIAGSATAAASSVVLTSFENPADFSGWQARDGGRAELVTGPTTDGSGYVRFEYVANPNGWPTLAAQGAAIGVTDWSPYDYVTIDIFNAGKESVILILRLDDASQKRDNRSVPLPPQTWTRWNIPIRDIRIDYQRVAAAYFHFDRPASGGTLYFDNWRLVKGEVPPLEPPLADARADQAREPQFDGPPGYTVATADTMVKIRIDAPFPESARMEANGGVSMSVAANEAEGFQLVLMPRGMDLDGVTLHATPLRQAEAHSVIPAEQITFHQVGYVNTKWPHYSVERAGWWPDPLLNPTRFSVRSGDVQPVWVTVRVPEGTPPGTYTGAITVRPANAEPTTVPLSVRVWDFSLPRTGSLPLAFTYFEDIAMRIHGPQDWVNKGLKTKYFDLILEHRLAPDNIYRRTPPSVEDVRYWNERGLTAFNIMQVGSKASYSEAEIRQTLDTIERALAEYRAAGLADKAYVYGFDEIKPDTYPGLKQMYGAVRERFPDLKRLSAMHIAPEVYGYVDAWANTIETYKPALAEERRAAGEEVWMYLSISGRHPYPNWFIDYPAIEARLVWWLAYLYDLDGFLYYAINHYDYRSGIVPKPIDVHAGAYTDWDPASFVTPQGNPFNGDGLLIYAGQDGPLASVRLANVRDGLEDYEYLKLLENHLVASGEASTRAEAVRQVKEMIAPVVRGLTAFTQEPATLRDVRDRIARTIEALKERAQP